MKINIVNCIFILDSVKNDNIRKTDIKKIKVLVNENSSLPELEYKTGNIKDKNKSFISKLIGSNTFHLEQVYTLENKNSIDIVYLGITNIENITKLDKNYKLVDFSINGNKEIVLDNINYKYKTIENIDGNNIEYTHEIEVKDSSLNRILLELLISYKRIRSNIDNTDVMFKFMASTFTLEDVRMVYELIKDTSVDKSNFRKKIIKYVEETNNTSDEKNGYRPSKKYKFKPLKGDVWV